MKSHGLAHFIVQQVVIQTQIAFNKPSKSSLSQEKEKVKYKQIEIYH